MWKEAEGPLSIESRRRLFGAFFFSRHFHNPASETHHSASNLGLHVLHRPPFQVLRMGVTRAGVHVFLKAVPQTKVPICP